MRPNGSTGFVKRADVKLATNPYRIEVRLGEFNLKVFKDDTAIMDTVGRRWPPTTPRRPAGSTTRPSW